MRPDGLHYAAGFIDEAEELTLLRHIEALTFDAVVMRGVTAKRTVKHFGLNYGYESWTVEETEPLPAFLEPLRHKVAAAMAVEPHDLREILVSRYEKGAGIGWHRDAPMFGIIGGVSLGAACVLRFRNPKVQPIERYNLLAEARSLYILTGNARWQWQHSIDASPALRHSITFRTMRKQPA